MGSPIVHLEVLANDHAALTRFYASQFGWEIRPMTDEYAMATTADGSPGVGIGAPMPGHDRMVVFYIEVDSVADALASIEQAGGGIVKERTVLPGMATYGLFSDPAGNVLGVVEPGRPEAE